MIEINKNDPGGKHILQFLPKNGFFEKEEILNNEINENIKN